MFNNAPITVFNNPKYISYVVEYQGDIEKDAALSSKLFISVINDKYAVITMPFNDPINDRYTMKNNPFPSVVYISRYYMYTLQGEIPLEKMSPIVTAKVDFMQNIKQLDLTGRGTVVAIIDTGIDYLNRELLKDDGTTRIVKIWDQSDSSHKSNEDFPLGSEYSSEQINEAIKAFNEGKSPYDIVPSRDEIGHGTAMAGIIGARGENEMLKGAAPECEFLVVKLGRATAVETYLNKEPIYDRGSIMIALQYVYDYAIKNDVPMVIYLPLGTTLGNHKRNGILEDFIDEICDNKGIIVITGTGNEGNSGNHASGSISKLGGFRDVDIYVSEGQEFLRLELWVENPNIMSVEIMSPSGESTGIIPAFLQKQQINKFIIEETTVSIEYFLPDDISGDELVFIGFAMLTSGIWRIRVYGDYIIDGKYDMWLMQKQLMSGETRFISPDNYATIMNPSPSRGSITVANYNQNNLNVVSSSGVYFFDSEFNQIDVAAGGVDVVTIAPNEKIVVANGTSVSAAVVAGIAAIIFQWGIVDKNNKEMYAQTLKYYFLMGTIKRDNDIYPNPQWGYGILDLLEIFKILG